MILNPLTLMFFIFIENQLINMISALSIHLNHLICALYVIKLS